MTLPIALGVFVKLYVLPRKGYSRTLDLIQYSHYLAMESTQVSLFRRKLFILFFSFYRFFPSSPKLFILVCNVFPCLGPTSFFQLVTCLKLYYIIHVAVFSAFGCYYLSRGCKFDGEFNPAKHGYADPEEML